MDIAEKIYKLSPVILQNALITGYGLRLKKLRYGGQYNNYCNLLKETQYYSSEDLSALQSDSFVNLIRYACRHVPYYKNFIDDKSINASDITLDNYKDIFPLLTKETLRKYSNEFISRDAEHGKHLYINTSGTSGTPLRVAVYKAAIQHNYAFFTRLLSWAGINYGDRSATFAGRVFIPQGQKGPPYWRKNRFLNNLLFSSYNISGNTIPSYIEALGRFDPVYIDSYPSAIYEIAKHIIDNHLEHDIRPKAIITSSETLYDYQRSSIEEAFGCRVYDHLGCAEMVALISQCEHGYYHVNPEYGLLEVVDADGQPAPKGEPGQLVCTGLINLAMPLIRYVLGDSVILGDDECRCGRNFQVIKSIIGRTDDLIIACNGSKVGRLDPIFKGLDQSIKETQIIQNDLNKMTVKIVTDADYDSVNTGKIVSELKKRTGNCMNIRIEFVDSIPKSRSGKFRAVVSDINKPRNNSA